jgi:DNA segregation ATPase FtsK/SpoIIIE, S-DNA-T family
MPRDNRPPWAGYPMARSRRKTTRRSSRSQNKLAPVTEALQSAGDKILPALTGPAGQQILALSLIGFGLLTIFTTAGLNSGAVVNAWARALVFLFGWGAYPIGAMITGLGLLWLRHLVHQPTAWRWRPFIGFEMILIGMLTLTHTLISQLGWTLVQSGQGGGVIGWALYVFFNDYFGPLVTSFLMGGVTLIGIGLAFDVTGDNILNFGRRIASAWRALRARAPEFAPSEAEQLPLEASTNEDVPAPAVHTTAKPLSPNAKKKKRQRERVKATRRTHGESLPPLSLLKERRVVGMDEQEVQRKIKIIEKTLGQFGIPVEVPRSEVRPGPTVTQFGVVPGYISRGAEDEEQRKVRVSQIASLADDLTLALSAETIRIEAPVPGRAVVGIEVPNAHTSLVSLRTVLESDEFARCQGPLCFAVGLDISGRPIVADLARMPHLLVAGTTGSGKSIFIKSLAASLMMYNSPTDLRLVTIDPKIVELTHLNGLPHLLGKTETDLDESIRALRWVAHEMDQRYKQFSSAVARHLDSYNTKMARRGEETLPRILVMIDELADLMLYSPEETEQTLTRIAQMARATGIHLVVATQRPSTDVVTGLIKANFPARLSFATASSTDSRVILDTPGAEALLGRGDMLFLPPDASAPLRVQGCFLADEELEAIIEYWQEEAGEMPTVAPWTVMAESSGPASLRIEGADEDADLLEQAIEIAQKRGKISTSGLQRRLRISYPRAARLMEEMEEMGVVGPQPSAGRKRRVILGGED